MVESDDHAEEPDERLARKRKDIEDLTIREINNRINDEGAWHPIRRLVLFSSGVPRKLIDLVPVERTEFLVQGTGVLIAAALAFLGGFTTSSLLVEHPPPLPLRLLTGVGFSALIFTVDRLLVRSSLRPYDFPKDVLHTLWDPTADAKWFDVLTASVHRQGIQGVAKGFFTVMAKVLLRLALAAFVSYLVADLIVIYAFKPDIKARATSIKNAQHDHAYAVDLAAYNAAVAKAAAARTASQQTVNSNPAVASATANVTAQQKVVNNLTFDVSQLQALVYDEVHGVPGQRVRLSDGTVFPQGGKGTTGQTGCAGECNDDKSLLKSNEDNLKVAQATLNGYVRDKNDAAAKAGSGLGNIDGQYNTAVTTAANAQTEANKEADKLLKAPQGLLQLREALQELEADDNPGTTALDKQHPCSWLCTSLRKIFPTTPLGTFVGVFRGILFLIDILPITMKIYYSLRGRRPFDVLMAALEESSVADSMNKLDHQLNEIGGQMEMRAIDRRGERRGQGARLIRQRTVSERRERKRLETELRAQLEAQYTTRTSVPGYFRAWRRARSGMRWKMRRVPNQFLIAAPRQDESPWSEPRIFEPPIREGDVGRNGIR